MRYVLIPSTIMLPSGKDPKTGADQKTPFPFAVFIEQAITRHPNWADEWADDWDDWAKETIPAFTKAANESPGKYFALQDNEHEKFTLLVKALSPNDIAQLMAIMPYRHAVTRAARELPEGAELHAASS